MLEQLLAILAITPLNNSLGDYLFALAVATIVYVGLKLLVALIINAINTWHKASPFPVSKIPLTFVKRLGWPLYLSIGFLSAMQLLELPPQFETIRLAIILATITHHLALFSDVVAKDIIRHLASGSSKAAAQLLNIVVRILIWVGGTLVFLATLGINVTSIVTGLGIGGVAIALASKSLLEDLLNSFTILFDKPFAVGDLVSVGTNKGTVERIGIKTTRLRSPQGEELIVPNTEFTNSTVFNYRRMKERMVSFKLSVTYDTPPKTLAAIPEMIQAIIEPLDQIRFHRCQLVELGETGLLFDVVYYVETREFTPHIEAKHTINLAIVELFSKKNIAFAHPLYPHTTSKKTRE